MGKASIRKASISFLLGSIGFACKALEKQPRSITERSLEANVPIITSWTIEIPASVTVAILRVIF
jgi:hypothetical protein